MSEIVIELDYVKSTKRFHRYEEPGTEPPMTVYIRKRDMGDVAWPKAQAIFRPLPGIANEIKAEVNQVFKEEQKPAQE